jgi:basic membrane protein A
MTIAGAALLGFATPAHAAGGLTVGFIYVGPKTDYGYNQSHHEGAEVIAKMPGVKIREEEMVPETSAVQKTMESMINLDGATLLFPTSFGYFDPHILKEAVKYPNVTFFHCGGLYTEGKHPKNVGSYFGYIDEAQYISGIVAGLTTKTNKLGFIAAKPIPQVLRNINSYELGARSVNPKATTSVIFTGDWSMPVKEAEAANSLIDQGVDALTMHVDSPKVIVELAERRGIYVTGYHANQAALAPKGYLTGAEWNWGKVYTDYVNLIQSGKPYPHLLRGGLKDGFVKMSPYGKAVSAEAKKKADAAKAKFMAGTMVIYKGPIKDNTGKVVIPAGESLKQTDIKLEGMDYLVEGVVGKTH